MEITLNINVTVDGRVQATSPQAQVSVEEPQTEDAGRNHFIPDFKSNSGERIRFGRKTAPKDEQGS